VPTGWPSVGWIIAPPVEGQAMRPFAGGRRARSRLTGEETALREKVGRVGRRQWNKLEFVITARRPTAKLSDIQRKNDPE
jgi:hypothetical protein